ncbi:alpha/beta hydrolase fold-1 domain-containing protein [Tieghemostelium lacteum]|uniref:Alpha/beta hydrolase fold-1 domain-containing protein n=1 Tax=Tieghemostelium lacteum TaxID=361077 RepID=A0A151ZCF5_TIELA|nr:alpha/beta hydrolase fold-1 domain-containing protein [Tieghemostelium lacteum]|eukprot:KYQ91619.1 alpha/beta hydrolase fold-1 domain-containing protein [Tieghemostelium lacteum]
MNIKGIELTIPVGNGVNFVAKAYGPTDSKHRVIALHGWLDNANSFDLIAPVLAEAGIRVICLDFIGHGLSVHKAQRTNLYYTDYITQVLDVAEALRWKKFTLLGHSMGAGISGLLASVMPHMVEKVICLDFIGILTKEFATQNREMITNRKNHLYQSKQAIFDKFKTNNPFIADEAAHSLLNRAVETVIGPHGEQLYKLRHDPRLIGPSIFTMRETEVIKVLEEIKCPVLLIWGTVSAQQFAFKRDWTSTMENRMKSVKNLKFLHVDGSHHFHMETTSFCPDILDFIFSEASLMKFNPDLNLTFPTPQPENHNQIAETANSEDIEKIKTLKPKL